LIINGGSTNIFPDSVFKGTCDVTTDPGIPTTDEWWSATEVGIYTNFGGLEVTTLEGVYNWLVYDFETTTWTLETVPISWTGAYLPTTVSNILDGYITVDQAAGFKPYVARKAVNPGYPYLYNDSTYPTYYTNSLTLDGTFNAYNMR